MRRGRSAGADPSGANGHRTPDADGRESPDPLLQEVPAAAAAVGRCGEARRPPATESGWGRRLRCGWRSRSRCGEGRSEGEQNKAREGTRIWNLVGGMTTLPLYFCSSHNFTPVFLLISSWIFFFFWEKPTPAGYRGTLAIKTDGNRRNKLLIISVSVLWIFFITENSRHNKRKNWGAVYETTGSDNVFVSLSATG